MAEGISTIEITFPIGVELPIGFEEVLVSLVDMVCKNYESQHPDRTMWPAGIGSKPIWREPQEPLFDGSVFQIRVSEREASEREIARRAKRKAP